MQRDIKYYKCPRYGHVAAQCASKRAMIVLDNGNVESEHLSEDEMAPLEGGSDEENYGPYEVELPYGEALITRKH